MLKINSLVIIMLVSFAAYEIVFGTPNLADKIPKAFYPRLRKLCGNVPGFKKCMVEKKACSEAEANEFEDMATKMNVCPLPEDDALLKDRLNELAKSEDLVNKLSKFANKIGALMKCTK